MPTQACRLAQRRRQGARQSRHLRRLEVVLKFREIHSARLASGAGPQSPSCSTVAFAQGFGNRAHLVLRRTRFALRTVQSVASPAQGGLEVCGTAWVCVSPFVDCLLFCASRLPPTFGLAGRPGNSCPRCAFEFPAIPVAFSVLVEGSFSTFSAIKTVFNPHKRPLRQRLRSSLLIENVSVRVSAASLQLAAPRRFRSRLTTIRPCGTQ